ncbi:MAG: RpiB/LacA/LacB family sugar-phosphate isomerase [Phycisphaerales bacterium]|nr:RpiB/LacA/LacB family sugar-phosphate isomerase [Phycisphaerales bacterium]
MFITARQLEQIYRANGSIVLPYSARLTPAARDWAKLKQVQIGYGDMAAARDEVSCCGGGGTAKASVGSTCLPGPWLWWCDGPCAVVKAGLAGLDKQATLVAMDVVSDPKRTVEVIKKLAEQVKQGKAAGGILAVHSAAGALVWANRCSSLRAMPATTIRGLESGLREVAGNVLVIEHPQLTLMQARNLLSRFVRSQPKPDEAMQQQLNELR